MSWVQTLGIFGTTAATTATTVFGISNSQSTTTTGYANNAIGAWVQQQQASNAYANATAQANALAQVWVQQQYQPVYQAMYQGPALLAAGEYQLPDGAVLSVAADGSYVMKDESAKVIYRACRVREFNPYINASDLLEAFIAEVGEYDGVDQGDILDVPIEAFINWIILQAAKRDGDPLDGLPSVDSALRRRISGPVTQQKVREAPEEETISEQSLRPEEPIL